MSFVDIHDIGQIATLIGIPSTLIAIFIQIRSYRKDQREQARLQRESISAEILASGKHTLDKLEYKLEAMKAIAIVDKAELLVQKQDLQELKDYVEQLDKEGTTEWQKVKPLMLEKINQLHIRIDKWEKKFLESKE